MSLNLKTGNIPESEYSEQFLQGMINRMGVSFYKYGRVADAADYLDALESAQQRVDKYRETGNTEWLMDAANFIMMEFMQPRHPDAHYRATDSHESPGRLDIKGRNRRSQHNLDIDISV